MEVRLLLSVLSADRSQGGSLRALLLACRSRGPQGAGRQRLGLQTPLSGAPWLGASQGRGRGSLSETLSPAPISTKAQRLWTGTCLTTNCIEQPGGLRGVTVLRHYHVLPCGH